MAKLTDYQVLTFDCYGTLIDWEAGIWDALQPLIKRSGRSDVTRDDALLAFAKHEHRHQSESPGMRYPELLAHVHQSMAQSFDMMTSETLDEAFGESVPLWPAFPDTADALRILKRHYKLVILSNVHRNGFAASNRKLGVDFDAIYTAEDIGSYKPSDASFEYMLAHLKPDLGMNGADVLHTAQSLHHDHKPAKRFSLANAWIDRQRLSEGGSWGATEKVEDIPELDFRFFSMDEMAKAVENEKAWSACRPGNSLTALVRLEFWIIQSMNLTRCSPCHRVRGMVPTEYVLIGGVVAVLAFLWTLHRDMRSLSDRVSRLEGLLEGLRDAVVGRTPTNS